MKIETEKELPAWVEPMFRELPEKTKEILRTLDMAEEKGLTAQMDRLKDYAVSSVLEQKGMSFIRISNVPKTVEPKPRVTVERMDQKGEWLRMGWFWDWFCVPLRKYPGYVPLDVLQTIPKEAVRTAWILEKVNKVDPIIIIPTKLTDTLAIPTGNAIALYQWG